ncbi:MAG: metal-dependent hydrolase [Candidatus Odinarchaeota archaeon]
MKIYLIFHVALPLILAEIPPIKKFKINKISLIIGSLIPDIIDKPLLFLGLGVGRSFSHSLLFLIISFLIVYFSSKKNKSVSIPFLVGISIHLILDLPDIPYFYPFVLYDFPTPDNPVLYWFYKMLTDPIIILTETSGVFFIIFIVINNKLYHISNISNYLKGNNQFTKSTQTAKI